MENKTIKLISWNVNGIRAAFPKGVGDFIARGEYDIVCLQETKIHDHNLLPAEILSVDGYASFWHGYADGRKGYSGVAVYSKITPKAVKTNFGDNILSKEGRVLELDFGEFVLLNIYFPNGGRDEERLNYKLDFYKEFLAYVSELKKTGKNVVVCGDYNTAHNEIDLARPKENAKYSGFMPIEREWIDKIVKAEFVDTYRLINPDKVQYSWWDMKTFARDRGIGWRIDYFFVSESLKDKVVDAFILDEVFGSDHCPVGVTLAVSGQQ